jgi:hypothetical protein
VVLALMLPMLALKPAVALPAFMTMLEGTVITVDVELNVTVVAVETACDTVAMHELVAPDVTLLGLQVSEVTSNWAVKAIVTDCDEPL